MHPKVAAIIPARGGSKGIPGKNIALLACKPLIAYSIEQSLECTYIERTVVSTDDAEIAAVAKEYGAEVPFLRPAELAADDSPDLPVFVHALSWLNEHENYRPDLVVHLRPTSPLRKISQIDEAIELLIANEDADSVRSVCTPRQNPYKMWRPDGKYLTPLLQCDGLPEAYNSPRQSLPPVYWHNGYIDVIRYATIMQQKSMTGCSILPYLMETKHIIDIDDTATLELAEMMLGAPE